MLSDQGKSRHSLPYRGIHRIRTKTEASAKTLKRNLAKHWGIGDVGAAVHNIM